jgi:hypothetical protein
MKNKKTILWIALLVTAVISVYAQQYDSEKDFKIDWDPNVKDAVIITGYIGTKREVRIPPRIQNNTVTGIGDDAFYDCKNLKSISIPNSVTSIGDGAFGKCSSLTSITIPNTITSIKDSTFYLCSSLTSITIPNSVTSIGGFAFLGCTSLTSITIPDSVTRIGTSAFENCTSLTSITIPNSVTSIGGKAFTYCTKLTSVTLQGTISSDNFGGERETSFGTMRDSPFDGDLRAKYIASDGGSGTYTRFADGQVWRKQ